LSQWAPGGRGPWCLAPAAPMVVTSLATGSIMMMWQVDAASLLPS